MYGVKKFTTSQRAAKRKRRVQRQYSHFGPLPSIKCEKLIRLSCNVSLIKRGLDVNPEEFNAAYSPTYYLHHNPPAINSPAAALSKNPTQ